jgi:diacylglycerol kinase (ATP)
LRPELEAALVRRGVPVEVPDDVDGTRRAARVAFGRGDGVVVCGGDGTVAAVAGVAAEGEGTFAVVPTGAGNDFARHLGIGSRRPIDAVGLVETGRVATCDLGRVTGADGGSVWFTTVANTGFDSEANRWANGVRWATGTALYLLAVARTLVTYRPRTLRVVVDGEDCGGVAWLAAVGNTRFYAGGMMIVPGAEIDDGLLDVCVIGAVPRWEFVARFPRVFRGTHTREAAVTARRGKVVELDAPRDGGPPLELWAAGERVGALPARVEVVAGAVRVLVPDGAPVTGR